MIKLAIFIVLPRGEETFNIYLHLIGNLLKFSLSLGKTVQLTRLQNGKLPLTAMDQTRRGVAVLLAEFALKKKKKAGAT